MISISKISTCGSFNQYHWDMVLDSDTNAKNRHEKCSVLVDTRDARASRRSGCSGSQCLPEYRVEKCQRYGRYICVKN